MSEAPFRLKTCPIVEAVIDIRCDMPPAFDLVGLEDAARNVYRDSYGTFRKLVIQEHLFEHHGAEPPTFSARQGVQALQFFKQADDRQLIQILRQGFTFNRLAPYTSLDDYLSEFERTWKTFVNLAKPAQVREIHLRYINRLLLPMSKGSVEFNDYLKISPHLPDEQTLQFASFFNQHAAVEVGTGHLVNIIMTMQPAENDRLPVIFDIEVVAVGNAEPENWTWIRSKIDALRDLKNRVFKNTLTDRCLNLYSQ
jgi:uncharacterized protein (TIGR04255 family)